MVSKKNSRYACQQGNDKIVISQSTHNIPIGPMTHRKAKSTTALSLKQASKHTCFLKPIRTHDEYQQFITLASLGAKGQNPHSRENTFQH